jgi:hypothetical protein
MRTEPLGGERKAPHHNGLGLGCTTRSQQAYFLGRFANCELHRLHRFRCGFTLAPHLGQRRAFSLCTKSLRGRVLMAGHCGEKSLGPPTGPTVSGGIVQGYPPTRGLAIGIGPPARNAGSMLPRLLRGR